MKSKKGHSKAQNDSYDILGVPANVTESGIKKAFRKLARKCHPDLNPDDPDSNEKFAKIAEAYQTLKSDEKRKAVDAEIISEYCMTFLGMRKKGKKPDEDATTAFLEILKK